MFRNCVNLFDKQTNIIFCFKSSATSKINLNKGILINERLLMIN